MRHRIVRHRLAAWVDPASAFDLLYRDSTRAFWLDSGHGAVTGMSYLGKSDAWVTASVASGTVTEHPAATELPGTIFDYLRDRVKPGPGAESLPFGWVGWFGYELRAQTMPARGAGAGAGAEAGASTSGPRSLPPRRSRYPDAAFLDVTRLLAFDHSNRTVEIVALSAGWTKELARWRDSIVRRLLVPPATTPAPNPAAGPSSQRQPTLTWQDDDDEYAAKILACQRSIREGDAYQLCLTSEAVVDTHPHPVDAYLELRRTSPAHHGGYVRIGDVALLSASPETFLSVRGRVVESRPIKGTRPRGATPDSDRRMRGELETSEKERAENLMIVDLMRNDLGRICEIGSVTVPALLAIESYAHVHQLVSTVRGRLAIGAHPVDAIVACFPAGSMTGAPKSGAVEIIDALEHRARGIYSGAFGYVGVDGTIDLAVVIRSIVIDRQGATIGAGGGITVLSDVLEEVAEVRLKAAAMIAVLGAVPAASIE